MNNKFLKMIFMSTVVLGGAVLLSTTNADAHGYVETPISRGYQGFLDKENPAIGWSSALKQYGNVITNPQALEAYKGFPQAGPADGHIASAEGGFEQIGDFVLDQAGKDRWKKQEMKTGINKFTWKYTADHKTAKWHYYMTKTGWNPEKPLARKDLEKIGEIQHDGSTSLNNPTHDVVIPADRSGYHVILAVWDVADTSHAFYNVVDANITK